MSIEKHWKNSGNPSYRSLITSRRWKNLRLQKIKADPLCEKCLEAGRTTPAEQIHHINPILSGTSMEEMEKLAYDPSNLMSLCENCHNEIHHTPENIKNIEDNMKSDSKDFLKDFLGL